VKPLDPRLLRYAASARLFLAIGAVVGVIQTVSIIGIAWFLSAGVTAVIAGSTLSDIGGTVAGLVASVLVRAVTNGLLDSLAVRAAGSVKSELRLRMLRAVRRLGPGWLSARNGTQLSTVAGPGLDALDSYFSKYVPQLILTAIVTPVLIIVIALQDPLSGLIIALTIPVIPVFMILIGWSTQGMQNKQWKALTTLSSGFLDVVGGLSTLKIFGRQNRQADHIATLTNSYRERTMKVLRLSFLSGFALEFIASIAVAIVAVSIGLRMLDGGLGLGVGLFVLLLTPDAFIPLRQVGVNFHAAADGVAAAEDVFEVLESEPASVVVSCDTAVSDSVEVFATVRYGDRVVLDDFHAIFAPGAVTAITGPSGVGKSTLVAAILGFVAVEGSVTLAGRPLERDGVAWSGQRPGLVAGTIGENVSLGSAAASESLVTRALELAGAAELNPSVRLGDEGSGLSGGQAQRVAIARAYYRALERNCPVIVLDEPTSALDEAAEARVITGLRAMAAEGRTVLVVSHRASVIASAEYVLPLGSRSNSLREADPSFPDHGNHRTAALTDRGAER
jgi:ATP-binding cassette subfamily C protein CydD